MAEYYDPTRVEFRGLPVYLSGTALHTSASKNMTLYDIVAILEEGEDCAQSQRRSNTIERCATYRKERIKVVAMHTLHRRTGEECWLIVHLDEMERP